MFIGHLHEREIGGKGGLSHDHQQKISAKIFKLEM